jgi:transposase
VFKSGRDFAAWLGLTLRRNSSGEKAKLGVTKQGKRYIRELLVVGSTAVPRCAGKRRGPLAESIAALRARKAECPVAVALASKLARIYWAIIPTGELFRQETFA